MPGLLQVAPLHRWPEGSAPSEDCRVHPSLLAPVGDLVSEGVAVIELIVASSVSK